MTEHQRIVLDILISGLGEKRGQISAEIDYKKVLSCAIGHQTSVLTYYGLKNLDLFNDSLNSFKEHTYDIVYASVNQVYELERLKAEFDKCGIDYCVLKGAYIRQFYPKPEMRTMSDIDVLIRENQYKKIKPVMKQLGYNFCYESDHEITWKLQNGLVIELHKCLVPTYNKDFIDYYGDGWKVFENDQKLFEKQYVYSFVHFAKHYRDGGAGIKYVFDLYILQKAKPNMDMDYILSQFENLKLDSFYKNILATIKVWFEDAEETEVTRLITNNLFQSGVYGDFKQHAIAYAYKKSKQTGSVKKAKIWNLLSSAFSPLDAEKRRHRFLKSCPFLLPVAWVINWVTAIKENHNKIGDVFKKAAYSTEENVEKFRRDLLAVGLDYHD